MKILVTGLFGFIGEHLVNELKNSHKVEGIDLEFPPWDENDIRTAPLDTKYNIIYHLAALRGVPDSFKNPRDYFDTNVFGTYRLLSQAKYNKFVNISSSSAEEAISPYGMSKYLGECMVSKFDNVINVRPFNVFGEGQTVDGVLVRNFCKAMQNNENVFIYGTGHQRKDFTYVVDFVKELVHIAENNSSGNFEIGYQNPTSVNYIFHYLAEIFNYDKKPIYTEPRVGDIPYSIARNKMNIEPVGLLEGLARTAEWWKNAECSNS